jgi:predicted benzoate:H+ symporter BenE
MVANGVQLVKHLVPAVIKPARTLWHEVIGFLFLSLAGIIVLSAFRSWKRFDGSVPAVLAMAMHAFLILLLGGYGVSSFLRARKISRS